MRATTWRLLVSIVVVTGVVTWAGLRVWTNRRGTLPEVPWTTAVVIGLFALGVLVSALALRPRLRGKVGSRPVAPMVAARFGVLSLACSRAGAVFVGVYGGFLVTAIPDLDIDFRRHIAIVSGLCVLAAALLITAALILERTCRLPPPPQSPEDSPALE